MGKKERRELILGQALSAWAATSGEDERTRRRLDRGSFAQPWPPDSFLARSEGAILEASREDLRAARAWLDVQILRAIETGVPVDRMVPSYFLPSRIERAARYVSGGTS